MGRPVGEQPLSLARPRFAARRRSRRQFGCLRLSSAAFFRRIAPTVHRARRRHPIASRNAHGMRHGMNRLGSFTASYAPALVAASGPVLPIASSNSSPPTSARAHAPRLCARGDGVLRSDRGEGRDAARGHREHRCRGLYRGIAPRAIRADRKAAAGRVETFVRLDGDRPDHADQPGRGTSCGAARRRYSIAPRRGSSSTRSTRRRS